MTDLTGLCWILLLEAQMLQMIDAELFVVRRFNETGEDQLKVKIYKPQHLLTYILI